MGNKSSTGNKITPAASAKASSKASIEIPVTKPGYSLPEPPTLNVDDIRPPIPWYQDDEEEDEFDWSEVQKDHSRSDDGGGLFTTNVSLLDTTAPKTPKSVLTAASLMSGPLSNHPKLTPSGRTFVHQERIKNAAMKRSSSSVSTGAVSLHSAIRRPHTHPGHMQLTFTSVDEHARKAGKQHTITFTALIDYLRQPIRFHQFPELMTARAIISWLAYQKHSKSLFTKGDTSTPKGLLQLVATNKISHTEAYVILCREAGLQCVLIYGVSKPDELEPLDDNIKLKPDRWTAVHVEGDWQIVHPYWMCKSIVASSVGVQDWINKETKSKGRKRSEVVKTVKKIIKSFVNEDYFMPAPEVFIHSNYPNDARWQLLSPEYSIGTREGFLALPFLFPAFFRLGLRLVTTPSFVLYSKNGKCKIWIASDFDNAHRIGLTYKLYLINTHYAKSEILLPNLGRQVIHCRHNDKFYFEVRFPVEGVFKLEIHGGYYNKSHSMKLCYFKLVCEQRLTNFLYLPYDPDKLMWGPGPVCEEFGLLLPSKPTGLVKVYEQATPPYQEHISALQRPTFKLRYFVFQLHAIKSKTLSYAVEFHGYHSDLAKEVASPFDENGQLVDKTKKKRKKAGDIYPENNPDCTFYAERDDVQKLLTVTVNVPYKGEFALVIKAVEYKIDVDGVAKAIGDEVVVCVYLIRTVEDSHRENVHQKLARNELQSVMQGKNNSAIRNAVDKCIRVKMDPNDVEIVAAQTKAEYLDYRKAVFDAIHRRNYRIVNEVLLKISKYKHKGALATEIRRLFALRKQLKKLLEFPKYVPELRHAAGELIQLKNPPPEVHLTMGALFLLLEEPDKYIESWDYIVKQLKAGRHGESPIIRKMYLIAEMFPSKNTRRKILTLLTEYNIEQVKTISVAAARFYVWVQKVMVVFQDLDFDLQLQPDTEQLTAEMKEENMQQTAQPDNALEEEKQKDTDILTEDLMEGETRQQLTQPENDPLAEKQNDADIMIKEMMKGENSQQPTKPENAPVEGAQNDHVPTEELMQGESNRQPTQSGSAPMAEKQNDADIMIEELVNGENNQQPTESENAPMTEKQNGTDTIIEELMKSETNRQPSQPGNASVAEKQKRVVILS